MHCLWLVNIVQTLHFDLSAVLFTSKELCTQMPTLSFDFQDVYRILLGRDKPACPLPLGRGGGFSSDDGLLLLMALLSDLLYLRQSFERVSHPMTCSDRAEIRYNPFIPFTPHMERDHMEARLSLALETWDGWFSAETSSEVQALYRYSRMYLSFDRLLTLPSLSGYGGRDPAVTLPDGLSITDEAVREAWRVLDSATARTEPTWATRLCPIWLPIVVFHAGLVVWAQHVLYTDTSPRYAGNESVRVLQAFKVELDIMPWPCCTEMAATLRRLIEAQVHRKT